CLALHMRDVVIIKATHHMNNGVDLADGGEELVAQALAFGGAANEPGDIDERNARWNYLLRFPERRQLAKPRIRHGDLAHIWLDSAERIIGGLRRRSLRKGIEERRLADIRQADDAALESHGEFSR